jgi:hypothetical protein
MFAEIQISLKKKMVGVILLSPGNLTMPTFDFEMSPEMLQVGVESSGDQTAVALRDCGLLAEDAKYAVVDLDKVTN